MTGRPSVCSGDAQFGVSRSSPAAVSFEAIVSRPQKFRDAEIQKLRFALCVDQDVARFQIAVDDVIVMRHFHRGADFQENPEPLRDRKIVLADVSD